jgi:hypothetical protein
MHTDVPLSQEEVSSALSHARVKYDPAKRTLADAVNAALKKKDERDAKCAFKKVCLCICACAFVCECMYIYIYIYRR